jgi:hypothetical protein
MRGTIIIERTNTKSTRLKGALWRANPKPAKALEKTVRMVEGIAMRTEFQKYLKKGYSTSAV